MLRERERRKTLILIHVINYLQLRSIYIYTSLGELTTIHVTYIKKERLYTIYTLYSTVSTNTLPLSHMNMLSHTHNEVKSHFLLSFRF